MSGLGPLISVRTLLENYVPTSNFGEGPIVLAHMNKYTVGSINEWFTESDVEKLDWPSQKSDLNPNKIC